LHQAEWLSFQSDGTSWDGICPEAPPEDTCTYDTGTWIVDCSDNCDIEDVTDMGGEDLIFTGTGTFAVNANIENIGDITYVKTCPVAVNKGKRFG